MTCSSPAVMTSALSVASVGLIEPSLPTTAAFRAGGGRTSPSRRRCARESPARAPRCPLVRARPLPRRVPLAKGVQRPNNSDLPHGRPVNAGPSRTRTIARPTRGTGAPLGSAASLSISALAPESPCTQAEDGDVYTFCTVSPTGRANSAPMARGCPGQIPERGERQGPEAWADRDQERQQLVEALPDDTAPKYLLRDRDGIYGEAFTRRVTRMGIRQVLTAPRAPWPIPSWDGSSDRFAASASTTSSSGTRPISAGS